MDPALLPCLSGGRGGLRNQSRHPCRTVWARPGRVCTSLSCTRPLCPLPSFLTDAEGHTGWGDSGRGGFVFAYGFRRPLSSGALSAVRPSPISSPFLAATPGLQAGTEGTELGTLPVLGLTVCPLCFGESFLQAAYPRLLISCLWLASAAGGQGRGEARIFCPLSQHLGESLAAAASLLWLQIRLDGLCRQGPSFTGSSSSVPHSTRSGNTVSAGAPAAPGVGASSGSTSCSC